jgi:hypothetical protein
MRCTYTHIESDTVNLKHTFFSYMHTYNIHRRTRAGLLNQHEHVLSSILIHTYYTLTKQHSLGLLVFQARQARHVHACMHTSIQYPVVIFFSAGALSSNFCRLYLWVHIKHIHVHAPTKQYLLRCRLFHLCHYHLLHCPSATSAWHVAAIVLRPATISW